MVERDHADKRTGRREYLALLTSGTAMALAGCGGDGDGAGDPTATETRSETEGRVDETLEWVNHQSQSHEVRPQFNPRANDWAPASARNGPSFYTVYEPLTLYNIRSAEYEDMLLDSVSVDGKTVDVTIKDGYTWSNGDPVTGEDLVPHYYFNAIQSQINDRLTRESVRATGELSFQFKTTSEWNTRIVRENTLTTFGPNMPAEEFMRFVESHRDATSDEERKSVYNPTGQEGNLNEFRWELEDAFTSGIFTPTQINDTSMDFELHTGHPKAENVNFTNAKSVFINREKIFPAMQGGEVDVTKLAGGGRARDLNDNWIVEPIPTFGGWAMVTDHDDPIMGKRKVRQAFFHIIDTEKVAKAIGPSQNTSVPKDHVGVHNGIHDQITDGMEGLITYDSEEEATRLLQEAGFSHEDGTWYTPDDEEWKPELNAFTAWSDRARSVAGMMDNFDINVQLKIREGGTYWSERGYVGNQYALAMDHWSTTFTPSAWGCLNSDTSRGKRGNFVTINDVYEVPPYNEPDGEPEEFNVIEMLNDAATMSGEEYNQQMKKIAWVRHHSLFAAVPITHRIFPGYYNKNRFDWGDTSRDIYGTASNKGHRFSQPLRRGAIEAKGN